MNIDMEIEPKHRVFIHEVGHFVANTINFEIYGIHEVDRICLKKHSYLFPIEYTGETILKVPEGADPHLPLVNLPQKVASLLYGCYFQSILLIKDLELCFDYSNPDSNGFHDSNDVISALTSFKFSSEQRKSLYPYLTNEYFSLLKDDNHVENFILELCPDDFYIEINEFETQIDIAALKLISRSFILNHKKMYLQLVSKIEDIQIGNV